MFIRKKSNDICRSFGGNINWISTYPNANGRIVAIGSTNHVAQIAQTTQRPFIEMGRPRFSLLDLGNTIRHSFGNYANDGRVVAGLGGNLY